MKATGVSGLMRKMYLLEQKIDKIGDNVNINSPSGSQSSGVISDILPMLTSIQSQIITGFAETKEAVANLTDKNDITDVHDNDDNYRLFMYNGAFHKIPEGYKFTATTIAEFWNLYYFRVPAINLRPLRLLERKYFHLLNIDSVYKNIFSNGCCVMKVLSQSLQSVALISDIRALNNASLEESILLFLEAYKRFINKYCAGKDNRPAIATAYRKI